MAIYRWYRYYKYHIVSNVGRASLFNIIIWYPW